MKTFNATELNKNAAKVFRTADQEGSVKINHDRYPDKVFIIEGRPRRDRVDYCRACGKEQPVTESGLSSCHESFMVTTTRAGYASDQKFRDAQRLRNAEATALADDASILTREDKE